ncbi:Peroxiredoxin [Thermodesulfobium acidiphilum]|uniref:Peroxiredoxin n=1 Tax=Thermodesulfobium acidiphilum TaxID=1794699 RepID=A0A2R4W2L1_THEAF|nr:TlpA disulfide reductase family protein [Thermodesulfobium acidiphilum]AWB11059.1 Peroxiredoxin [Thermodesulfobium acidiphilum]PMP85037.1 MAG: alkyl hydroperoxide reductase [Thermodesulfobium narugense]
MKYIFFIVLLIGILALSGCGQRVEQKETIRNESENQLIGKLAPNFKLKDMAGFEVNLSQYRGKPLLLVFWATWCPHCRVEMPQINKLYKSFKEDVLVFGINEEDEESRILKFMSDYPLSFPILPDKNGEVARLYKVNSIPAVFFIDPSGVIRNVDVGETSITTIENWLKPYVKEVRSNGRSN